MFPWLQLQPSCFRSTQAARKPQQSLQKMYGRSAKRFLRAAVHMRGMHAKSVQGAQETPFFERPCTEGGCLPRLCRVLPEGEPIDLASICFDGGASPDRLSALDALEELRAVAPSRPWRFIAVNATLDDFHAHKDHIVGELLDIFCCLTTRLCAIVLLSSACLSRQSPSPHILVLTHSLMELASRQSAACPTPMLLTRIQLHQSRVCSLPKTNQLRRNQFCRLGCNPKILPSSHALQMGFGPRRKHSCQSRHCCLEHSMEHGSHVAGRSRFSPCGTPCQSHPYTAKKLVFFAFHQVKVQVSTVSSSWSSCAEINRSIKAHKHSWLTSEGCLQPCWPHQTH